MKGEVDMNNSFRRQSFNNDNISNNIPLNNSFSNQNIDNTNNSINISCPVNDNLLDVLCNYIGRRCICEFDTNNELESKTGILERIGNDYLILRALNNNRIMFCKTCNLIFITIMC